MALVEYSDSDSDSEAPVQPTAAPTAPGPNSKKPFQKVVNRANPGKIVVNLPQTKREDVASADDTPPAKRTKTGGGGGGMFAGFSSLLPAPKNAAKRPSALSSSSSSSRPVFQLKTSAEAGFSRDSPVADSGGEGEGSGLSLPPPKTAPQPSIPETMKPEEEVKLVGKPMMFRPLSVARNKKKPAKKLPQPAAAAAAAAVPVPAAAAPSNEAAAERVQSYLDEGCALRKHPTPTTAPTSDKESLHTIANDLNLSAAERRELFGRGGPSNAQGAAATRVINFNTDQEYQHNEDLRASGQEQTHNPRALDRARQAQPPAARQCCAEQPRCAGGELRQGQEQSQGRVEPVRMVGG
ncbi:conserved hypothetical protein [Verticillium alfalfae VaMs.102]|uniref:Uncharacterized protein n=1 Tax=Verticillium alfalfae (strain VaMs.102 / ATCC MYA-4576 / FGSC 10136) TaxID=526221 RepID=C9SV98_VERA1|nr:conserved hypothetical protein [Verticillium alfalfae VaMs.102]EEY22713.1 conserved hypothetical protein [Verticillium alfalfae VaMs.102]